MESRIQHISKQHTKNCNQFKSVTESSLQHKCTQSTTLSSNELQGNFPWRDKFIEATLFPCSEVDIEPLDNPWHLME